MTIEALPADEHGENVQRWAAAGLPVPPSWRISREAVRALHGDGLIQRLRGLPGLFTGERYWVLHQGAMNAESKRESLLNLDSDEALAAALNSVFGRDGAPDQVVVQALPRQRAAGVLFTRHPLRQDLSHMVVEGVVDGGVERQRVIFDEHGRLVYRSETRHETLDQVVGATQLHALADGLRQGFERPQAGEWVFDGDTLWLLQTLPVGSLPEPLEVWTRRAASALFNQAVTPLWYTLAGRWLKTHFWMPLAARHGWTDLARVEPYRRQQSHLYSNSEFFRRLLTDHPGVIDKLPPAWQPLPAKAPTTPTGKTSHWRNRLALAAIERRLARWRLPPADRERLWRSLMTLDRLGERLARFDGRLSYLTLPDALLEWRRPLPLSALLDEREQAALAAVSAGNPAALDDSDLRPGADPVHAPLSEKPAQWHSLRGAERSFREPILTPGSASLAAPLTDRLAQWRLARRLRFALGDHLRRILRYMAALLVNEGLLAHPDDVFFLYFDELWELWMRRRLPTSAAGEVIGQRKVRYLEDAHAGAPDWKMDRIGFGFGAGRLSPVLRGESLVPGRVGGPLRRLCSAWGLNRLHPGDIVVVDQVDPSWVPWLAQVGGLVIAGRDPLNAAASLAEAAAIPAIWGVSDIMHSVIDGQTATLDGDAGTIKVVS